MSPEDPAERGEWREALLTYLPAVALAFVLNWALVRHGGWAPRRALVTSIGAGIVLALLLQRWLHRRGGGAG